jgi:hypothetical protein
VQVVQQEEKTQQPEIKGQIFGVVPTGRSSRSEVPTDRSSADLRYQRADLANLRYQQETDLVQI